MTTARRFRRADPGSLSLAGWIAAAWMAIAAGATLASAREVSRNFPVRPGCTLYLDTFRGTIDIEESDAAEVQVWIEMQAEADSEAEADRLCREVELDFSTQDNAVRIVARNRRESGLRFVWDEDERVEMYFRVAVPRECHVDLRAIQSTMTIGNLAGRMRARIESGTISFRRIEGSIEAEAGEGDIVISRCSGAVTARVRRGLIRVGTIGGALDLQNSTGDIEVMTAKAAVLASATVGNVTVGFRAPIMTGSRLEAAAGNIQVRLDPTARCQVDASAVFGRVQSRLPMKITSGGDGQRKFAGLLNGGGPLIRLRASGGQVTIEPAEILFE